MRWVVVVLFLWAMEGQAASLQSIYASLDPTSVSQHFAFYELYPESVQGKQALRHAWELLNGGQDVEVILPPTDVQPIIAFVNRIPSLDGALVLAEDQLNAIEKLARHLGNRKLAGFGLWDGEKLKGLQSSEIDLARGLFLAEMEKDSAEERLRVRSYEANIDLMALQILARLPEGAKAQDKIRAINDYIFSEMRFRFPPHSLYAKDIDVFTLLPSVLDGRRGVCLGVSILYLCLAQRLDLELEAITPPGHIYVRYVDPKTDETVNIETTARGIDLPSEVYLSIEARKLQQRSVREVIGLAFFNQASVSWHRGDAATTIKLYEKAMPFLPDDYLLYMFLGYNYLFAGRVEEGTALLKKIRGVVPDHMVSGDSVVEDYFDGKTSVAAIRTVYSEVDEKRSSILEKQKKLQEVVDQFPEFRQGILHLAITWLQLGREKEALPILERYYSLHPTDPVANYYLASLHLQRFNYNKSWKFLHEAEELVQARDHHPKALKELRQALQRACPEPQL